jgi:hypothetical protein
LATNYKQLCQQILSLNNDIRFAGIAVMEGKIVAAQYREGVKPFLTREESELSFMQALIRMNTRRTMEDKIGRPQYSITEYERVIRSTMMVYDENNRLQLGNEFVLLASFEKTAQDPLYIVKKQIMPLIKEKLLPI